VRAITRRQREPFFGKEREIITDEVELWGPGQTHNEKEGR